MSVCIFALYFVSIHLFIELIVWIAVENISHVLPNRPKPTKSNPTLTQNNGMIWRGWWRWWEFIRIMKLKQLHIHGCALAHIYLARITSHCHTVIQRRWWIFIIRMYVDIRLQSVAVLDQTCSVVYFPKATEYWTLRKFFHFFCLRNPFFPLNHMYALQMSESVIESFAQESESYCAFLVDGTLLYAAVKIICEAQHLPAGYALDPEQAPIWEENLIATSSLCYLWISLQYQTALTDNGWDSTLHLSAWSVWSQSTLWTKKHIAGFSTFAVCNLLWQSQILFSKPMGC